MIEIPAIFFAFASFFVGFVIFFLDLLGFESATTSTNTEINVLFMTIACLSTSHFLVERARMGFSELRLFITNNALQLNRIVDPVECNGCRVSKE